MTEDNKSMLAGIIPTDAEMASTERKLDATPTGVILPPDQVAELSDRVTAHELTITQLTYERDHALAERDAHARLGAENAQLREQLEVANKARGELADAILAAGADRRDLEKQLAISDGLRGAMADAVAPTISAAVDEQDTVLVAIENILIGYESGATRPVTALTAIRYHLDEVAFTGHPAKGSTPS